MARTVLAPNFAGIPAHAQTHDCWLVWAEEEVGGRPTKVPYMAGDLSRHASTSDPSTWRSYARAKAFYLGHKDALAGVGCCRRGGAYFFDGDGFFRKLLPDDVSEGWEFERYGVTFAVWEGWKGRQPRDWYLLLVAAQAWMELSPSCLGLHAVLWSETIVAGFQVEVPGVEHTGVALYTGNRYLAVTGAMLAPGNPDFDSHEALESMRLWLPAAAEARERERTVIAPGAQVVADAFAAAGFGSDEDVIARVKRDKRGGILWNGGDPGGLADSSPSGLDFHLCQRIAFYGGPDPGRIDRIFRASALCRDKWEREDYRRKTIAEALAITSEFWKPKPKRVRTAAASPARDADAAPDPPADFPSNTSTASSSSPPPPGSAWRSMLLTAKGRPLSCLANADAVLRHAPEWKNALVFDEFANVIRTVKDCQPPTPLGEIRSWTDTHATKAAIWMQREDVPVTSGMVQEAVIAVAGDHRVHPLRDYLASLRWDGTERIKGWLCCYLGVKPSEYASKAGAWWLGQAVARAFHPGTQADYTLVLEGEQGLRKSQALRLLASDDWFTDQIADFASKDSSMDLQGKWIIELGEFDRLAHKPSVVKAFLTRQTDHFRPPYGRNSKEFPRQCVFAATVNLDEYLTDASGNRRFWPVRCGTIDLDRLARDRDQLWAEAVRRFRDNRERRWPFEPDEVKAFTGEQEDREELDVWHDRVAEWILAPRLAYDDRGQEPMGPMNHSRPGHVTVAEILMHALRIEEGKQTQSMKQRVAQTLHRLKWKCGRHGPKDARYRAYEPENKPEPEP